MVIQTGQQNLYGLFSSQVTTKYLIESYFGVISYEDGDWIDIHDPRVMKLLKLPRTVNITYNNSVPVTTHSMMFYGTSSLWWLIVACSDYIHPHEIPTNSLISIPSLNDITTAFTEVFTGLRNKVVTI